MAELETEAGVSGIEIETNWRWSQPLFFFDVIMIVARDCFFSSFPPFEWLVTSTTDISPTRKPAKNDGKLKRSKQKPACLLLLAGPGLDGMGSDSGPVPSVMMWTGTNRPKKLGIRGSDETNKRDNETCVAANLHLAIVVWSLTLVWRSLPDKHSYKNRHLPTNSCFNVQLTASRHHPMQRHRDPRRTLGAKCFVLVVVSLLSPDFEITWNETHPQVHDNFLSGIRIEYLSNVIGSIQFRQVVSKIRPIHIASLSDASFGRRCRVASQEHISGRSSSPIWFPPIRFLPACVVSTIGLPGLAPTHNLRPPD